MRLEEYDDHDDVWGLLFRASPFFFLFESAFENPRVRKKPKKKYQSPNFRKLNLAECYIFKCLVNLLRNLEKLAPICQKI